MPIIPLYVVIQFHEDHLLLQGNSLEHSIRVIMESTIHYLKQLQAQQAVVE